MPRPASSGNLHPSYNSHLRTPNTQTLPVTQRSLEEIIVTRRQTQSLLSTYTAAQPPLEFLAMAKDRDREAAARARRGVTKKYPGVSNLMVESMSTGVLRYGGVGKADRGNLPGKKTRGNQMFMNTFVRPLTTGGDYGMGTDSFDERMGTPMGDSVNPNGATREKPTENMMKETMKGAMKGTMNGTMNMGSTMNSGLAPADTEVSDMTPVQVQAALIARLTKQCNDLAWRVVSMEGELAACGRKDAFLPQANVEAARERQNETMGATPAYEMRSKPKKISKERALTMVVDDGVRQPTLPKLLPIEKAANNISSLIMDLTKSLYGDATSQSESAAMTEALRIQKKEKERYELYIEARREWKRMHGEDLVCVLRMEVERQDKMEAKIKVFRKMLDNKKTEVHLQEWHILMKENLVQRKETLRLASEMEGRHFLRVMKVMVTLWADAAHGKYSRKGSMDRHRDRMEEARVVLTKKLESRGELAGLITKEMLVEESIRMVMDRLEKNRVYHSRLQCLHAMSNAVVEAKEQERESIKHYKLKILGKVFYPWTEWTYLNSIGLDKARWKAPRKLVVSYNQVAVDNFSDHRVKKLFFRLWAPVTRRLGDAKRMRRRFQSNFLRRHLMAWQVVGRYQRGLTRWSIAEWQAYSVRLTEVPFRMWFVWMDQRKRKKTDQQRLVTAYIRTKHRKFLWNILRGWRHQAVYGRIAGLYSRNDLMRSLTEQKQQCKMMETEMNAYVGNVNDMNKMLEENTKKVKEMEIAVRKKDGKAMELRLAMHHCEQEMVKMQSLVDCVQQVAPGVAKHINELQGGSFDFGARGLNALVELRKTEEKQTGKETALSKTDLAVEDDDGGLLFGAEEDEEGKGGEDEGEKAAPVDDGVIDADSQRMNWVLNRADFRGIDMQTIVKDDEDSEGEDAGEKDPKVEVLELRQQLVNLYGLFEFLRGGDINVLSKREREAFEEAKIAGATLQEQKRVEEEKKEQDALDEEEDALALADAGEEVNAEGGEVPQTNSPKRKTMAKKKEVADDEPLVPVDRRWKKITNPATVTGQPYQWKDFVLSLNRKLPKNRKTETTQDKLMTRMQIGKERRENLVNKSSQKRQARPIEVPTADVNDNMYTGKDFVDEARPVTPRGWSLDPR